MKQQMDAVMAINFLQQRKRRGMVVAQMVSRIQGTFFFLRIQDGTHAQRAMGMLPIEMGDRQSAIVEAVFLMRVHSYKESRVQHEEENIDADSKNQLMEG